MTRSTNMYMRLTNALAICLLFLCGCSNDPSVYEPQLFQDGHSVIFASTHPFKNPHAFADSIANLAEADSIASYDTLTVTINDTIYFMGILGSSAEKNLHYEWSFNNPDSTIESNGLNQEKWVFTKTSDKGINCPLANSNLYCPLFIAIKGHHRDTAGKEQFIRVINTPPYLRLPKDTLWIPSKGDITFPIVAKDSFGYIKKIKIFFNIKENSSPENWKYSKVNGTDSLYITIPYNKSYINPTGNQKIYVVVADDDNNESIDSINIHYNRPPTLEIISPIDNGLYSTSERLVFFYKATDADNPDSLRYFIRVAKSTDNLETPPTLTSNDIIAQNITDISFEPHATEFNDSNVIVTLKNPEKILSGTLFWDMGVTDGYDTTYSNKIKTNGDSLRPRKFFHGDIKDSTGTIKGVIKYEGRTNHSGICITLLDANGNRHYTYTTDDGSFSISAKADSYNLTASSNAKYKYKDTTLTNLSIKAYNTKNIGTIILKDTDNPVISFSQREIDTISMASFSLDGRFHDQGSQVASATAILDGVIIPFNKFSSDTWSVELHDMEDGLHHFSISAKDSAGRQSETAEVSFIVQTTSIHIMVNGQNTIIQENSKPFVFSAELSKASVADELVWKSNVPKFNPVHHNITNFVDTLKFSKASEIGELGSGKMYEMYAETPGGIKSNIVRFGIFGKDPIIYFEKPSNDTTITIDDRILFSVFFYPGEGESGTPSIKTIGEGCNRSFNSGVKIGEDESIHWDKPGDKKVIIYFEKNGKKAADTLRVKVIEDPPTIKIQNKLNNTKKKINSTQTVDILSFDKFGTIKEIKWTCSNNPIVFDNDVSITENDTVTAQINFTMPETASDNYMCVVRATDDDNMYGYDTITYNVTEDKPYLQLSLHEETTKIGNSVTIDGIALDTLGSIQNYRFYCDSVKKNLGSINDKDWSYRTKLKTQVIVPNSPCTWYCLVNAIDDDELIAADTVIYTVVLDPPWVDVMEKNKLVKDDGPVILDALYGDSLGHIVKFEWECAAEENSINFNWISRESPRYRIERSEFNKKNYDCVIRVTDDDGNQATDTTHIKFLN